MKIKLKFIKYFFKPTQNPEHEISQLRLNWTSAPPTSTLNCSTCKNHSLLSIQTLCNFQRLLMFSLLRSTTMPFAFCYVYTPQSSRIAVISYIPCCFLGVGGVYVHKIHSCLKNNIQHHTKSDPFVKIVKRRVKLCI